MDAPILKTTTEQDFKRRVLKGDFVKLLRGLAFGGVPPEYLKKGQSFDRTGLSELEFENEILQQQMITAVNEAAAVFDCIVMQGQAHQEYVKTLIKQLMDVEGELRKANTELSLTRTKDES